MENQAQEPEFLYRTHGTCSRAIKFDLDDEARVKNVEFIGGCNGNAKGIASLIEGMPADWVIERCAGTQCGGKATSCPDQLSRALTWAIEQRQAQMSHDGDALTNKNPQLSRRAFLRLGGGALACATVLGAPALLTGCGGNSDSGTPSTLDVSTNDVVTLDAFAEIEDTTGYFEIKDLAQYPKGTMLYASEDVTAAALLTGETASPLSTCSLVNLGTGAMTPALDRAVNHDMGYSIFAVRASKELLVWVESNYLTSDWMVYCATISDGRLTGQPVKLDEGNVEFDTPEIAVIGTAAYWIVQPAEGGPRTTENSYLRVATGGSRSSDMITSEGRFNGGLSVSGQVLTAMPRAKASSGVYYELTAIAAGSGSVVASQVMPHSFRPSNAIYMNNAFAFTIPASYDYGGGIANVGTYYPIAGNTWLRLARQSLTPPGICNGWLFAKSSSRTVFIDTQEQKYFVVNAPDGCTDYGDYSVCTGEVSRVYNYATVNKYEGTERATQVVLRSITPIPAGQTPAPPAPDPTDPTTQPSTTPTEPTER